MQHKPSLCENSMKKECLSSHFPLEDMKYPDKKYFNYHSKRKYV